MTGTNPSGYSLSTSKVSIFIPCGDIPIIQLSTPSCAIHGGAYFSVGIFSIIDNQTNAYVVIFPTKVLVTNSIDPCHDISAFKFATM